MPGISRSGISISAGLFGLGLTREAATRFSFLMATPVIAGAGLFELKKLVSGEVATDVNAGAIAIGFLAAVAAGFAAIHVLLRFVRSHPMTGLRRVPAPPRGPRRRRRPLGLTRHAGTRWKS